MNINSVGSTSAAASQAGTGDAVAISVLKKALEVQTQGALQLIQSLPLPTTNSPAHLGNNVNTFV